MEQENISQFNDFELKPFFRRNLLPIWIKVFCWIFIFLGFFSIVSFASGLFGYSAGIEFYGMPSDTSLSVMGISVTIVLVFKAYAAYSLWFEKDNAIILSKIDAVAGIIICVAMMFIAPIVMNGSIPIRFEIIPLYLFYRRIDRLEYAWYNKQNE